MRTPPWKIWLVAGICLLALLANMPNFIPSAGLSWLPQGIASRGIVLGLDLQGGSHILLEVESDAVINDRLETLVGEVRNALRQQRIGYRGLGTQGQRLVFTLTDTAQADDTRTALRDINQLLPAVGFRAGSTRELDIEAGDNGRFTVSLTEAAREQRISAAITQSLEVVRRRIDEIGTREASIQRQGTDRILVQVPGERNPENIKRLLGQTARLTFHLLDLENSIQEAAAGRVPPGSMLLPSSDEEGPRQYLVKKQVELTGESLVDAQPTFQRNEPVVSFRFDNTGARKFAHITQENVGKPFAIVLDNKVISAPRIREPILGGSGIISGNFTVQNATELSVLLRAGALPAPLNVIEERSVGPELGADSIRAGAIASVGAIILVVAFMLAYYGVFGAIADLALLANLVIILGGMSLLGATLTLPGIAGIVLTMGMAVDSNVLIFERIHEEIGVGRSPLSAIDTGFKEAIRTIVDANLTTLIAAVVLFQFGTGPIKGFAVTLMIGVISTMFTAVTLSRVLVALWFRRARPVALAL